MLAVAFSLDPFGEVIHPFSLSEIGNSRFEVLKKRTAPSPPSP